MTRGSKSKGTRPARRRLGRGLDSLIAKPVDVDLPEQSQDQPQGKAETTSAPTADPPPTDIAAGGADPSPGPAGTSATPTSADPSDLPREAEAASGPGLRMISIDAISPGPHQPRRQFNEDGLTALAASIRRAGVMQPIVVRPADEEDRYQIVAGERRWRAAGRIGLNRIPAVVREVDDKTAAEWALIENVQREDLDPFERAEAFARLIDQFGLAHQEIAERVGLDRSSVSNHLRLLDLDEPVRDLVREGALGMGHARAILALANKSDRGPLAAEAAKRGWSVRELERRVRRLKGQGEGESDGPGRASVASDGRQRHMKELERVIGEQLGTRVTITAGRRKGSGTISIAFYNLDEFEGLLKRLGVDASQ